jgi:hypothetical protein
VHRPTKRRRSVTRMIGMALATGLYLTVLAAATQITGAGAAPAQPDGVAAMGVAAQEAPVAEARRLGDSTESPLLTLALAGAAIAAVAGYRLASAARRPRPAPMPVRGRRVSITT